MYMKQSEPELRMLRAKTAIESIMAEKGTVYTVGLLMGILCRLSRTDYQIVQDLERRAQDSSQE
jgi:hypothetical protein